MNNTIPTGVLQNDPTLCALPRSNPNQFYSLLREQYPAHKIRDKNCWLISNYTDIRHILTKPQVFSSIGMNNLAQPSWIEDKGIPEYPLVFQDPPQHTKLRQILSPLFVNREVKKRKDWHHQLARQCLNSIKDTNTFDFLNDIAIKYVDTTYSGFLGVNPDDTQTFELLHQWTKLQERLPINNDPEYLKLFKDVEFKVEQWINLQLEKHKNGGSTGVITAALASQSKTIDRCDAQLSKLMDLLIIAGLEVIPYTLCQCIRQLATNHSLFNLLKNNGQLVYPFIDEIIRLYPPVHFVARRSKTDYFFENTIVPANSCLILVIASANQDPSFFEDPLEINLKRTTQHLSFGLGIHQCLGKHVATNVIAALIQEITHKYSKVVDSNPGKIDEYVSYSTHGFNTLPITMTC